MRGVLLLVGAIGLIWLAGWLWEIVGRFSDILLLFFLAWLLAFVLNPAARRLQQLGTPRVFAVGLVYLGLLFLVIVAGIFIIPAAATQLFELSSSLPILVNDLQLRLNELQVTLLRLGISDEQLNEFNRDMMGRAQAVGAVLVANGLTIATTVVGSLLQASIVLILSFYIMLDGDRIGALYIALLPPRFRAGAMTAFENVDRTFGGFVRGQLIQSAIFGCGTAAVMVAAQLPYNLVLSILAGVAMIIPVVGPYIAIGPPVILTVILQPQDTWWVFTSLFILQFVVINVLMPRIMSQSVGLHPLLVFAAVLV
ncbi:MAG TPA: AI-2E family transporter, partial [Chloroflexota bacterium]|nr:AI-2E family transporter [Chloroflexota bacterium]